MAIETQSNLHGCVARSIFLNVRGTREKMSKLACHEQCGISVGGLAGALNVEIVPTGYEPLPTRQLTCLRGRFVMVGGRRKACDCVKKVRTAKKSAPRARATDFTFVANAINSLRQKNICPRALWTQLSYVFLVK